MKQITILAILATLMVGCPDSPGMLLEPDGGVDSHVMEDATVEEDAGLVDAGEDVDAHVPDEDAGVEDDAGTDAGIPDEDASVPDEDGGVEADAGIPVPFCGDGNVDEGEECDDGNSVNAGDTCQNNCLNSVYLFAWDGKASSSGTPLFAACPSGSTIVNLTVTNNMEWGSYNDNSVFCSNPNDCHATRQSATILTEYFTQCDAALSTKNTCTGTATFYRLCRSEGMVPVSNPLMPANSVYQYMRPNPI